MRAISFGVSIKADIKRERVLVMGKATEDLRKEHDTILHVLDTTDKIISSEAEDIKKMQFGEELVYFLKTFVDKCHHGKEENYLFKELESHGIPNEGGPIGVMLKEHQESRILIALMDKAMKTNDLANLKINARNYSSLLRKHVEKENNVLFAMADKVLNDKKQEVLFENFEQHEANIIGHGIHEKLHSMIYKWSEEFKLQ